MRNPFKKGNKKSKRLLISLGLVSIVSSIFAPAAFAGSGDPWYAQPFTWFLDFMYGILGGIHDPADHIFYQGCGILGTTFKACADRSVWGLFTTQQYNTVLYRGFWMFAGLSMGFICASVIKSGVLLSFSRLSSTLKFEVNDALIKTVVATILIGQFFSITSAFFSLNNAVVNMVAKDLMKPQVVVDNKGNVIPNDGRSIQDWRIEMNSLCENTSELTSPIARAACALTVRGAAVWWEVFYLQRKFMIAILVILAPLWISCMFYPMLHGVTMTAWKELWAQIISQALHAVLFWIYYHLIDDQMGWFQMLVGMCLFIPISESIRFIFGATSRTGGMLAAAGTMVGAAGMMNLTKGMMTVGKGLVNGHKAYKGIPTDNNQSSGAGHGLPGMGGNKAGGGSAGASYGGSVADNGAGRPISMQQRKLRAAGEIGAGLGRAAGRMAFGFAGAGMGGGAGAYIGGEIGEAVGDGAGYRAGAAGLIGGRAVSKGAAAAGKRITEFPSNFKEAYDNMTNRDGDWSAKAAKAASVAAQGGTAKVDAKRNPPPPTPQQKAANLAEARERAAERAGAIGEVVYGRGGYDIGDSKARSSHAGRTLNPSALTDLRDQQGAKKVFTLETATSSVLATKDNITGEYKPISNLGRGNSSLRTGETVVTPYEIQGKGNSVRLTPVKEAVSIPGTAGAGTDGGRKVEYVTASYLHNDQGKTAYNGKTIDANLFISPSQQDAAVDLRRQNFVPKRKTSTT
ncbi:hypothetical protein ACFQI7_28005 [Paenibacillus allorhizosphaerae]|uniref:Uncharacterized protein n=1 Tax=Paenibacillus allorhizosphaerae TaxID=2849866 RepID=A0ABN7TTR2_9BACL|nr:hypothetical protein [Paenibacillus allorhizosphaerae]CAG7651620.1 hypothetical protein PAECIP111802_05010 [Paenibacillus allorhizosphaerae]